MNEQDIKTMVESILQNLISEQGIKTAEASPTDVKSESCEVEDGCLEDITTYDLRKWFLVPNPHDRDGYLKMKSYTPSRIGVWRAGTSYMTQTTLRFKADHAAAQDAVFSDVSEELITEMGFIPVKTICNDKDEYVTRPDFGRMFDDENVAIMQSKLKKNPKIQLVVGDGLSAAAIEANIKDIIPSIKQGLKTYNLDIGEILFVKYCRVSAMDQIGEATGADVVCLLIGERPGLVTAESMSAYVAYRPSVGMPEANRTVISNIHKGGTPAVEAGAYVAELLNKVLTKKKSGIDLKES